MYVAGPLYRIFAKALGPSLGFAMPHTYTHAHISVFFATDTWLLSRSLRQQLVIFMFEENRISDHSILMAGRSKVLAWAGSGWVWQPPAGSLVYNRLRM